MTTLHPEIERITQRIIERSAESRAQYLELIRANRPDGFARKKLTEGNQAHASAGCAVMDSVRGTQNSMSAAHTCCASNRASG